MILKKECTKLQLNSRRWKKKRKKKKGGGGEKSDFIFSFKIIWDISMFPQLYIPTATHLTLTIIQEFVGT